MRTCKVRPTYFQCGLCLDYQIENSTVALCDQCEPANKIFDLVCMTDDFAIVMDERGEMERVEAERIYDIQKEEEY